MFKGLGTHFTRYLRSVEKSIEILNKRYPRISELSVIPFRRTSFGKIVSIAKLSASISYLAVLLPLLIKASRQIRNKKSADSRRPGIAPVVLKKYVDYTGSIVDEGEYKVPREKGGYIYIHGGEETRARTRKEEHSGMRLREKEEVGGKIVEREKGQGEQGSDSGPVINEESNFQAGGRLDELKAHCYSMRDGGREGGGGARRVGGREGGSERGRAVG